MFRLFKPTIHHAGRRTLAIVAAVTVVTVAALLGCSPMHNSHGFIPDQELVDKLRPGVHDRDSVTALFGSPATVADFNGETWLYVKRDSEQIAFFEEKLLNQDVLAVHFDKDGLLTDIRRYSMADGKILALVERKTPTRGREITVIEQLFGNIGRFSSQ
ncbi:MAG: outer membrane protein assembly factor BamE [Alphaproteobacteria bacterium]|jgi:outer membrane protein assembly factor BamE (lipoprotein component of BamABCDE complex)